MTTPPTSPSPLERSLKWLLLASALVALVASVKLLPVQAWLHAALGWLAEMGPWGPVLFVVLYAGAAILFMPGSILTLGAGVLFGVVWGTVYVSLASTLGATGAFIVGRYFARDAIARKIEGDARFAAIDRAVAQEGWKIVGLTRLSPLFPFALLNYAFGLTRVSLRDYVLASWAGMLPGTVLYVYLGSLAKAAGGPHTRSTGEWLFYGAGLLATLGVTIFITRIARRALNSRLTA
ncbi:MAG: TVP38/TMEM64 family protein [Opitutae bacterium]|nr:TVP38/TMEM64 family protein [Opitutae bacterium]